MQGTILANLFIADYMKQAPAWFYNRILVGAGMMITPTFVQKYGITHVINCADPEASPIWFRKTYPLNYTCLNAVDSRFVNILDWYQDFESTLRRFLREGNGTIFIHCQCGINRSASLALAYVCKNFHLDFFDTMMYTKKQRPIMFQNTVFTEQVRKFINGYLQNSQNQGHSNK